jgi:hypothetical protein
MIILKYIFKKKIGDLDWINLNLKTFPHGNKSALYKEPVRTAL